MASTITDFSRLSRNKVTGNFIILTSLFLFFIYVLNIYNTSTFNSLDSIYIFSSLTFMIIFVLFINKYLRKPFFLAILRYIGELNDRKLDTQQAAVKIDLIKPLQTVTSLEPILYEIDELRSKIKGIITKTSKEISMNTPPIRTPRVQNELKIIKRLAKESLEEIEKKRNNVIFLVEARKVILSTINRQINTPRHEIDSDYLLFKIQKQLKNHILDDVLLERIIRHAIEQGELIGELKCNEIGELVLAIEDIPKNEIIGNISWDNAENPEYYCVICRQAIKSSETITVCPICHNVFHRTHLLEWLKVFNQCPICHNRVTLFSNQR